MTENAKLMYFTNPVKQMPPQKPLTFWVWWCKQGNILQRSFA